MDKTSITITGDGNVIGDHSQAGAVKLQTEIRAAPYDTAKLRALLMEAFSSEELRSVIFDSFRQVYEESPEAEPKPALIQRLVEFATRHNLLGKLLAILQSLNPQAFASFPDLLQR